LKLNRLEFLLMNNPLRALIQEKYEFPALQRIMALRRPDRVLEIGCGSGNGTRLLHRHYQPGRLTAIDLDERMVRIAMERNDTGNTSFQVMDASALAFAGNAFDVVVDFGMMHHLPNWRDGVSELKRVLKPGGELIMEDLSIDSFSGFPGRAYRPLMIHPYRHMYSVDAFVDHVRACGFTISDLRRTRPLGLIQFFYLAARA
jgi:ubiquinone/menaquinone biosynthesis C-methylase UbiE